MSQSVDWEKLKHHKQDLLLAEVAALLHDVGKFTDIHVEHHAKNGTRKWSNDDAYKVVVDEPQSVIQLSSAAANIKKPDIVNNVLKATSPKAADFLPDELKRNLQSLHVNLLDQDYSLAELIILGMPGFATHQHRPQLLDGKDGWLPALLGLCHNVAHVDKEDPIGGEQSLPSILVSNAFGYEQQTFALGDPQESLDARLQQIAFDFTDLLTTRQRILEVFECGLGDTRRPTNEVSLADWSEIVAALFKTALAGATLTQTTQAWPEIRQWKSWKDKIIDHDFHWRLLRVNFDVLALYAKAIKIADLLGYQRAVEEACEQVKKLVEEEYPLGNEVYRDTSGIYFTFPDLDLPADLAQEIRRRVEEVELELVPRIDVTVGDGQTATEQLKGILAKARREARQALAQPFDGQNLSACWQQQWETVGKGNWELCPVCRLRPMKEGAEACAHCDDRRGSRIQGWQQDPSRTIWMDELADHNDRVALLVGKFGLDDWLTGDLVQTMLVKADPQKNEFTPKNPSPARLRRVWETCQRFWTETVEQGILAQHEYGQDTKNPQLRRIRWLIVPDKKNGWKENVPYDGTVDGKPISLLWRDDAEQFVTIINLQLTGEIKQGQTITVSDPDEPRKQITFNTQSVEKAKDKMGEYTPFLPLLSSPDQFLALVPADDALEIAEQIRKAYIQQFGKVQNRLPLFLGIVFFPRKMPLMAVMDAARRMLEVTLDSGQWTVNGNPVNQEIYALKLKQNAQEIMLHVPTKMGDGNTDDVWYPYFIVEHFADGSPDTRRYRFQHNSRWLVHVSDLRSGDTVSITPSRFAYLWLEHTAKRFEFDPQRDLLLLDELPRLMEMWDKICETPEMTDTKLRGVQALLEAKGTAWGGTSDEFRNLAQTTLTRAEMLDAVTLEDVTSGRFARCLELYTKILKRKVKED